MNISSALKKAWKEVKEMATEKIKLNVIGNETFTVNLITGEISGKTYHAKDWIKRNFQARWDPQRKIWVAETNELKAEFEKNAKYYSKYIVSENTAKTENNEPDEILSEELVNRNDGFYNKKIWKSGKVTYSFVG